MGLSQTRPIPRSPDGDKNEDDKAKAEKEDRVEYSEDGNAIDNDDNLILGDVYPLRPPQSPLWLPTELLPEK